MLHHIYECLKESGSGHYIMRKTLVEDTSKMPELPEASSVVKRLKAASDKVHEKRKGIMRKWDKNI